MHNRTNFRRGCIGMLALLLLAASPSATAAQESADRDATWIAAWGAPISGSGSGSADGTVRNVARVSLGGEAVRIRVSNALSGDTPLTIGSASIAMRDGTAGPGIVSGTSRQITFDGEPGVVVPPGTDYLYSDPVAFPVDALDHVAVSLYLPEDSNPGASAADFSTSYATPSGAGDRTTEEDGESFTTSLTSTYALTAIDVLTTEANGAIVGLGSSSTHGSGTTRDSNRRFIDALAVRGQEHVAHGERKGFVSAGIGGDTLRSSLATRYDRDVLSQSGVTGVILWNINDLALGSRDHREVIADYRIAIARAHAEGVRAFCPTWPPASHTFALSGATQEASKLNAWILNSGECDDVVDWHGVLTDDLLPTYRREYQADTIHFNDAGHTAITDATPVRWFTTPPLEGE